MEKLRDYLNSSQYHLIYDLFADETSKQIYQNLLLQNITHDYQYVYNAIRLSGIEPDPVLQFHIELLSSLSMFGKRSVLYGLGSQAEAMFKLAREKEGKMGYLNVPMITDIPWAAYCDKADKRNGKYQPFIFPEELAANYSDALVAVTSTRYFKEIKEELCGYGVAEENICLYQPIMVELYEEQQYFDSAFMKPQQETLFIDGGCFRCDTAARFLEWNKGFGNEGVLSFEPDPCNFKLCTEIAAGLPGNVRVIHAGLSDKKSEMSFSALGNDESCFSNDGNCRVRLTTIDDAVQQRDVSFIKLDVEGFELDALRGAEKTIKRCRPRLAVCAYHKTTDLIDIPEYIAELSCGYRFYLRMYCNEYLEIVLYAIA